MTTVNNKKCYPSEKYLNELITNIEFAARAPVEVVRAIAAELQKHRKAYANTAASKDGWISCSERMPDSNCLYLCWGTYFEGDEPDYIPAYFFVHKTNGWTEWQPVEDDCNPREVIITHWMPLPAAPKQEVK
ncbi:TPA: DUF551 domain-containing protein [Escherichia coli]|uniref:DUF551 domain-containing protein n=1 Tax=Escherichia coli TaxID=562 RepID=UPI001AECF333|nr:DUF551 domain-containing protein [Escherichia coli]MBP2709739.1 DUF551 domain-containing protein [Escherichia coli]